MSINSTLPWSTLGAVREHRGSWDRSTRRSRPVVPVAEEPALAVVAVVAMAPVPAAECPGGWENLKERLAAHLVFASSVALLVFAAMGSMHSSPVGVGCCAARCGAEGARPGGSGAGWMELRGQSSSPSGRVLKARVFCTPAVTGRSSWR